MGAGVTLELIFDEPQVGPFIGLEKREHGGTVMMFNPPIDQYLYLSLSPLFFLLNMVFEL